MGIEAIELLIGHEEGIKEVDTVDMMDSIASMATGMSAARMAMEVSVAVEKKIMDAQELAGQELFAMMPETPSVPLGQFVDTYA